MFKKSFESWPIALFVLLFIALSNFVGLTKSIDNRLYDYFLHFKQTQAPKDVVIIAVDERSIDVLGKWPWSREVHIQLLQQLQRYHPKLIAFDILFIEQDKDLDLDQKFTRAVQEMGNVILPVYIGSIAEADNSLRIFVREPKLGLAEAAAALGHVQLHPDADGIGRSVYLFQGVSVNGDSNVSGQDTQDENKHARIWPHFGLAAYGFLSKRIQKNPLFQALDENVRYTNIIQEDRYFVPFIGPAGSFTTVSYIDVLLGRVATAQLKDKIFFVGATALGLGDNLTAPIMGSERPMSGVEGHANIFQALRSHTLITWLPYKPVAWISVLACIVFASLGVWFSARTVLILAFISVAGVFFLNFVLLRYLNIWLPSATLLVGTIAVYPLWSFYRLGQTVRFLNEELSRVKNAPNLFAPPQELVEFETGLNSFLMGGLISAWWIGDINDQRLIIAGDMPYEYNTTRLISESALFLNGREYQWACVWVDSDSKNKFVHYLETQSDINQRILDRGQIQEYLSASIYYLRNANQQARVIYNMSRETLHNMQGAILVLDRAGRILFANHNANQLYKLAEISLENHHVFYCMNALFADNNDIKTSLKRLVFEDVPINEEVKFNDERHFLLQANKVELMLAQEIILITMSDISAMKRLQEARAEALQFLSHDLRAPMVSILTLLEEAKDKGGVMSAEMIDSCSQLARKNLSYANNYLQIVRAEEGTMNTDLIDAIGIFDTAIANVYSQAQQYKIKIISGWPDEVVWVNANVDLLSRALQNLLDNALKYSPKGSEVKVAIQVEEVRVGFSVSDQGMGIPEEEQTGLFKSFKRATNAKNSDIEGTGLGLRFVDIVSKRHGGSIDVKSVLNEGSQFILWLPKA